MLYAIVWSFVWSWPMALCAILITPFLLIAGFIAAKADQQELMGMEEEVSENDKSDD